MTKITTNSYIDSMFKLSCYAFNKINNKQNLLPYQTLAKNSETFGIIKDNQITNQIMSIPRVAHFNNQTLNMHGIGYVASYPEARGKGEIKELFLESLANMKENNIPLSYLAPFSQTFYRKFGYENAIWKKHYSFNEKSWPFLKKYPKGTFLRCTWEDNEKIEIIKELYQKLLAPKDGNLNRETWWWEYLKDKKIKYNFAIILDNKQKPKGYIVYQMTDKFEIMELAYPDFETLCQLLEFASRHTSTFSNFQYLGHINEDITNCFLDNQFIDISIKPFMMARIVDFENFYHLSKNPILEPITIKVNDPSCSWNNHTFKLNNDQISINDNIDCDFEGDISTWSAIFLGVITLEQAIKQHDIICHSSKNITFKKQINPLSLSDYF